MSEEITSHQRERGRRPPARVELTAPGADSRSLSAALAHILRITGGRVSELVQITDAARWHDVLAH